MRLPAAERREQLLRTAVTVFAANGYHATSMNDVAVAAGVTKPVLYQHFSSKRQLFVEILGQIGTELRDTIDTATARAEGPRQQIENGLRAYFRYVGEHTDSFRVLFGAGARRDPEFAAFARAVEESVADMVAALIVVEGEPVEHSRLLAHSIVGMTESGSRYWIAHDRSPDVDTLAAQLAQLAWSGLRGINSGEGHRAASAAGSMAT